jgi:cyclopropane fatty-acyl-phospholipid synthase-like methyltransferase
MATWNVIFKREGRFFDTPDPEIKKFSTLLKKYDLCRVLDLGCGSGRHMVYLAKNGFQVFGMDVATHGLKEAKKWLKSEGLKARLIRSSCYKKFPFGDNNFDAIISTQVIHHNYHDNVIFCISEIKRTVKKGGIVIVSISAGNTNKHNRKSRNVAPNTIIPLEGMDKGVPHYIYNISRIRKDFQGFNIIHCYRKDNHIYLIGRKI